MKLLTFRKDGVTHVGLYLDGRVLDLPRAYMKIFNTDTAPDFLYDMKKLISLGQPALEILEKIKDAKGPLYPPGEIVWEPPVPNPEKIFAVAINYRAHAQETGTPPPERPYFFPKFPNALVGHESRVVKPKISKMVDWEVELVAVVGKAGKYIDPEEAFSHIFGYMVGNDISTRDWQFPKNPSPLGPQWIWAKSMDSAAPTGPYIVTRDELPDPHHVSLRLKVNGDVEQEGNTRDLIFDIPQLVHWASQGITLKPGDLIFTGTPPGVGMAKGKFLKGGDIVEAEAEGIGVLRNYVVEE
ncbi:MAG: fumarylacetoacetate hydrolase family protein, partial [Pyrobaculum sp.]